MRTRLTLSLGFKLQELWRLKDSPVKKKHVYDRDSRKELNFQGSKGKKSLFGAIRICRAKPSEEIVWRPGL
jgi:hypothetical protein